MDDVQSGGATESSTHVVFNEKYGWRVHTRVRVCMCVCLCGAYVCVACVACVARVARVARVALARGHSQA